MENTYTLPAADYHLGGQPKEQTVFHDPDRSIQLLLQMHWILDHTKGAVKDVVATIADEWLVIGA